MRDIWRFGKERLLTGMEFVSSCQWRVEFQRQNSQEHQQREGEDLRLFHCRMQTRLDSYLRSKALALQKEGKIIPSDLKTRLGIKSPTLQILSSVRSYKESTTVMGWGTPFPHHITEFIQIEDRIPQAQTRAMEQFFMFKFMLQGPRIFFLPRMHVYSLIL